MRLSFHNHSNVSPDSWVTIPQLIERCKKLKVDAITLTDHDTINPEFRRYQNLGVQLIIGEEVTTKEGDLIGLFLKYPIKPGGTFAETLKEIKKQGGITIVPHPCDRIRKHAIKPGVVRENADLIDVIEIFNSRTIFSTDNYAAEAIARELKKIIIVGNDGHTLSEIGNAIVDIKPFDDAESFLKSLRFATFQTERSPLMVHGATLITKIIKRVFNV